MFIGTFKRLKENSLVTMNELRIDLYSRNQISLNSYLVENSMIP